MSCQDIRRDLARYVADSLGDERRAELRGHLGTCRACQVELERYQGLLGELDALEAHEAPDGLSASTMDLIRSRAPRPEAPSIWVRLRVLLNPQVLVPALGGVALACFMLLGSPSNQGMHGTTASLSGIASVETSDGALSNASGLQEVPYGATVVAFAPNDSVLTYPGGSRVVLKPNARARVGEDGLQLLDGRAECRFGEKPFHLAWRDHRIEGAGAHVQVLRDDAGRAVLEVLDGRIRVLAPSSAPRSLSAGERITLDAGM